MRSLYLYLFFLFKPRWMEQTILKGNAQFVEKVTFEPLMDFKQSYY